MGVWKPKNSPFYYYEFRLDGQRFYGRTGQKTRREAERFEDRCRKAIESPCGKPEITLDKAAQLFWEQKARFEKNARTVEYQMERLVTGLGKTAYVSEIAMRDLIAYQTRARGRITQRGAAAANRSVNAEVPQLYRRLWHWMQAQGYHVGAQPIWKSLRLQEAAGRSRELNAAEQAALMRALRPDLRPIVQFGLLTGLRKDNLVRLTWRQVDMDGGVITIMTKSRRPGGEVLQIPITTAMRAVLGAERGNNPIRVFTYICRRATQNRQRGQRYPFSSAGWQRAWRAALGAAGIEDFRFHDLRHTAATRTMRATGNLKAVQRQLGHSDIASTARYAHVSLPDLARAMEDTHSQTIPKAGLVKGAKDGTN